MSRTMLRPNMKTICNIRALCDNFIDGQIAKQNSKYTIKYYQHFINQLGKCIDIDTEDISIMESQSFIARFIQSIDGNQQTINSYLRGLRAFYNFCFENEFINVPIHVAIKNIDPDVKQVYSEDEIKKLLKKPNYKQFTNYRDWVSINILLGTGIRLNSLINIKVKDVDFDNGYLYINVAKRDKKFALPIQSKLKLILQKYISLYRDNPDEYLICNKYGEQFHPDGFKKTIKQYNLSNVC